MLDSRPHSGDVSRLGRRGVRAGAFRPDLQARCASARRLQDEPDLVLRNHGRPGAESARGDAGTARPAPIDPPRGHLRSGRRLPHQLCSRIREHSSRRTYGGASSDVAVPSPATGLGPSGQCPRRGGKLGSQILCARVRGSPAAAPRDAGNWSIQATPPVHLQGFTPITAPIMLADSRTLVPANVWWGEL